MSYFYCGFLKRTKLTNDYRVQIKESKIKPREKVQKAVQECNTGGTGKGLYNSHFKFLRLDEREDLRILFTEG